MPVENPILAPLQPDSASRPSPLKVGFVSLGCPKNLVDSEVMMGMLHTGGAQITARAEDADVIVVNTCSFIDSAKQESVNTILEMAQHKITGKARKLIVAGCLVERYRTEIQKNIPEVDAVVGTGELDAILAAAGIKLAALAADDSPFVILNHSSNSQALKSGMPARAEGWPASRADASPARSGTAPSPTCPTIFTTKPRPACWPRPRRRLTSRSPKAATILAASASFRNCAASFVHAILNP